MNIKQLARRVQELESELREQSDAFADLNDAVGEYVRGVLAKSEFISVATQVDARFHLPGPYEPRDDSEYAISRRELWDKFAQEDNAEQESQSGSPGQSQSG
jgi:hypothetical protein